MFRRRKDNEDGTAAKPPAGDGDDHPLRLKPATQAAPRPAVSSSTTEIRRAVEGAPARRVEQRSAAQPAGAPAAGEGKKLTVGKDISLAGEISSCEKLVVEGRVQADVGDCQEIEIAPTGLFRGTAEVESAEIAGRFEGRLTVRGRLLVLAGGRVEGEICYGRLEVHCGGEICGTIREAAAQPVLNVHSLAKGEREPAGGGPRAAE